VLVRTGAKTQTGERETWLLIKHRDQWAGDVDVAVEFPRSIKTDRSFEEIVKSDPDLWKSHKPATADLQKIVDKVLALEESSSTTGARRSRR
jgi:hypothetical protein